MSNRVKYLFDFVPQLFPSARFFDHDLRMAVPLIRCSKSNVA